MNGLYLLFVASAFTVAAEAPGRLAETWRTGYAGTDAKGPHVLGYWRFQPDQPTADSSGRGQTLKLSGAAASSVGRFDGSLESFPGWPVKDENHAALAAAKPWLSPKGAFTIEMWIKPKAELTPSLSPVLIDKKYVANTDYQWRLSPADKGGARRMLVILGFGDGSETFPSEPFEPGEDWQHVAFTYDGAGAVRFYRNGASLGGADRPGRGPVAAGSHGLSIGDRLGSNYAGFPGFLDEVRLCDGLREFRPVAVEFQADRKTWLRMEPAEPLRVVVRNQSKTPAKGIKLRLLIEGLGGRTYDAPEIASGASHELLYPLDTSMRPDSYRLQARLEMPGETPFTSTESAEFVIAPRPLARMPVMMWGLGSPESVAEELPRLMDLGFTHCLGGGADYGAIWAAKAPAPPADEKRIAAVKGMLDLALARGFGIAFALSPGHWLKDRADLQRVNREGKPYADRPDVNAALPGLTEFCFNVGASVARTYSGFPAWKATLINTEVRDSSQVSFSRFDHEAYRAFAGADVPKEVTIKNGVDWTKLKDFPADRVIADDHPIRKYYEWFWTVGDGWNALHTATHKGIHSTGRDDVWTWFDPAIRAASVGGSGGEVDVLGQWTYTNPDPLRIAYFADELFAMAANAPKPPGVMKMTQLFWYRAQTAPKKAGAAHVGSPFDDHDPDAAYITISPMHLRESFWTKLARPVNGLMYHGWQALVPTDGTAGYRYTHPDAKEEFRRLHRQVLEPLGPTLLRVGDHKSDVAYLDSFTAQMFARRGSYGYSGDAAYRTLLHAQLQPEVIYEAQVLQRGLDDFKLLVLADCDVLPKGVAERILAFQKRGGLIIGDDHLAPAIKPDFLLAAIPRSGKADATKAAVLAAAAKLRSALDARYVRATDSTNPEIVTRLRTAHGGGDYVFVVNDHREFGDYVGQHGLVMENGAPSAGEVTLNRPSGRVYDLVAGREVPARVQDGKLRWPVNLGPCDGRVYLVAAEPIAALKLDAPEAVARGGKAAVSVQIVDAAGKPTAAVVPVEVEITDSSGRIAEFSGWRAAEGGRLAIPLDVAKNDAPGVWRIHARERASGEESTVYMRVKQ